MEKKPVDYNNPDNYAALLSSLAGSCARREVCRREAFDKMRRRQVPDEVAARIVAELQRRGFIDERRYARAFCADKLRLSGWGRWKISAALAAKGIDEKTAREALSEVLHEDEDGGKRILEIARRKASRLDLDSREGRMKLFRHLLSRGFDSSEVYPVVEKLAGKNDDCEP